MKRPVFINLAVDWSNAGCAHAQTDLGVPIDEAFEREGRGASNSLVRGCNPRQGVFHDYSHVFVL